MALMHHREAGPFDRAIDVQVGRLRRKIERDPAEPELIKSVRGVGYLFAARVSPE
jgi:DNA-binding response OmpR family regulator